jgi:hypothetical protein
MGAHVCASHTSAAVTREPSAGYHCIVLLHVFKRFWTKNVTYILTVKITTKLHIEVDRKMWECYENDSLMWEPRYGGRYHITVV